MDWSCQACGNKEPNVRYPVLKWLPDSDPLEIYVCENCLPQFERVKYFLQRMDGQLIALEKRAKWWMHDVPLYYAHSHIDYLDVEEYLPRLDGSQRFKYIQEHAINLELLPPLNDFLLVEDFEVSMESSIAKHELHKKRIPYFFAMLYSPTLGYLGTFSGNMKSNYLCQPDFVIPHGDFTLPYYDFDQGIDQLIFEDEQYVYILSGDGKFHSTGEAGIVKCYYDRWFKVSKQRYYEQWEIAIQWSCAYHGELREP